MRNSINGAMKESIHESIHDFEKKGERSHFSALQNSIRGYGKERQLLVGGQSIDPTTHRSMHQCISPSIDLTLGTGRRTVERRHAAEDEPMVQEHTLRL